MELGPSTIRPDGPTSGQRRSSTPRATRTPRSGGLTHDPTAGLALFTEYTPTIPNKTGEKRDVHGRPARHRFAPIKIEDRLTWVRCSTRQLPPSNPRTPSTESREERVSSPWTPPRTVPATPAETQAMLFERAQIPGRMGVEAASVGAITWPVR